jgi:hypothetical protein
VLWYWNNTYKGLSLLEQYGSSRTCSSKI